MRPDPANPNIAAFLDKAMIGEPEMEMVLQKGAKEGDDPRCERGPLSAVRLDMVRGQADARP